jgi:hypothetical protein
MKGIGRRVRPLADNRLTDADDAIFAADVRHIALASSTLPKE